MDSRLRGKDGREGGGKDGINALGKTARQVANYTQIPLNLVTLRP